MIKTKKTSACEVILEKTFEGMFQPYPEREKLFLENSHPLTLLAANGVGYERKQAMAEIEEKNEKASFGLVNVIFGANDPLLFIQTLRKNLLDEFGSQPVIEIFAFFHMNDVQKRLIKIFENKSHCDVERAFGCLRVYIEQLETYQAAEILRRFLGLFDFIEEDYENVKKELKEAGILK